jgi:hypothetical protein
MTDTSGPRLSEPFATYDHEQSFWRTSVLSFLHPNGEPFSRTWPKQGSIRNGRAYEHRTWVPPTDVSEYSLLRTPQASVVDSKRGIKLAGRSPSDPQVGLADQVKALMPTPKVTADRSSRSSLTREGHWSAPALGQVAEFVAGELPREYESWDEVQGWHKGLAPEDPDRLLPTPTARDWKGGTTPTSPEATRRSRGDGGASDLPSVVKLLPTPCADPDGKSPEAHLAAKARMPGGARTEPTSLSVVAKLLPTPTVGDSVAARNATVNRGPESAATAHSGTTLTDAVILLPTPTTQPTTGNGHARSLGKEARLLPTPQARDGKGEPGDNFNRGNLTHLPKLLPTPRASDVNGSGTHGEGGTDLRTQVQSIGETTELPSTDGNPLSDERHPTLWMERDA